MPSRRSLFRRALFRALSLRTLTGPSSSDTYVNKPLFKAESSLPTTAATREGVSRWSVRDDVRVMLTVRVDDVRVT